MRVYRRSQRGFAASAASDAAARPLTKVLREIIPVCNSDPKIMALRATWALRLDGAEGERCGSVPQRRLVDESPSLLPIAPLRRID